MDAQDNKTEIRDALRTWLKAFNEKDKETLFAFYDSDAIYANDGAPLMRGLEQIGPWFEQAFQVMNGMMYFKEEALVPEDNMALLVGKFYFKPADAEGPQNETGRVAMVFRRAADGKWMLLFDMDNRPPDCVTDDFADAADEAFIS